MRHTPPAKFRRSDSLPVALAGPAVASAVLRYRHVNQAERWQSATMDRTGSTYVAAIPAGYTDTPYPLQYYFELKSAPDKAWLHPGFAPDLANQPYYVVRSV
jgi:hypothetical protein